MATATPRTDQGDPVPFDPHGIEPIPDEDRDSTPIQQFWIWAGANIAPINWVLGALGIILGLSLLETILVVAIGNLLGASLFGLYCVMGHRTGVNQMVLSRAAFGRRGAYLPAVGQMLMAMGWLGVNTWIVLDLVLGIFREMGYEAGTTAKYVTGFGIMGVQVLIAIFGFYAIRTFEKWTVPIAAAIMVVMSAVVWSRADIAWTNSTVSGGDKFTSITQLMTAIGVGWGISWLTWSSDYTRFVRPGTSDRSVFLSTALGIYIPTVWLASLGATIRSGGTEADPAQFVVATFGALSIPVLFVVMHGPVATNILNIYSASLSALSLDLKVRRWIVSAVAGVVGSISLIAFIQSADFATSFDHWMISIIVWITAWAGVTFVEFFVRRRGQVNVPELYEAPDRSIYGDINWAAIVAMLAGLVAGWAWEYGLVEEFQGPIATRVGNSDLSWLSAFVVSGGLYYLLMRLRGEESPVAARTGA